MHMHIHIPIHVHKHAGRCRPSQLLLGIGPSVAASIVTEAEEQCEQAQGDRCQQGDRICWYVYVYGKQLPPQPCVEGEGWRVGGLEGLRAEKVKGCRMAGWQVRAIGFNTYPAAFGKPLGPLEAICWPLGPSCLHRGLSWAPLGGWAILNPS